MKPDSLVISCSHRHLLHQHIVIYICSKKCKHRHYCFAKSVSISFKIDSIKYKNETRLEILIIFQLITLALHIDYSQLYFVEAYSGSRIYQPLVSHLNLIKSILQNENSQCGNFLYPLSFAPSTHCDLFIQPKSTDSSCCSAMSDSSLKIGSIKYKNKTGSEIMT